MVPLIPKPPISHRQKAAALVVAGTADFAQITLLPLLGFGYILDDIIDFITAGILIAICGFKWQFVLAFLIELVPALDLFPTWTAVVLLMPTHVEPQADPAQRVLTPPVVATPGQIEVAATVVPPVQGNPAQV